jgi:UDPglucose 6-dehydrogenase
MTDYKVIVDKSTVPVGTADRVRAAVQEALAERGVSLEFAVVSNPEFLKEGAAVDDFMRPDRIIVGADDERATLLMRAIYAPFSAQPRQAAADGYAQRRTHQVRGQRHAGDAHQLHERTGRLAERVGADIELVRHGIGSDPRIGTLSLRRHRLRRLVFSQGREGAGAHRPRVWYRSRRAGSRRSGQRGQKRVLVDKVSPASARTCRDALRPLGAGLQAGHRRHARGAESGDRARTAAPRRGDPAYDPVAMDEARRVFGDLPGLSFASNQADALRDADALLIATEWREFKSPDFEQMRVLLKQP